MILFKILINKYQLFLSLLLICTFSTCKNITKKDDLSDIYPPIVISVAPTNGSFDITTDVIIKATFIEDILSASITDRSFYLMQENNNIKSSVSVEKNIVTLTPESFLDKAKTYSVTLTTGVKDISMNSLERSYTWFFESSKQPTIISVIPVDGSEGIMLNSVIKVTFSEKMNSSTISSDSFIVTDGQNIIEGEISYFNTDTNTESYAQFSPNTNDSLLDNTTYIASILSTVTDLAGNRLESNYSWSFKTADFSAPALISVTPRDEAVEVSQTTTVAVVFNEEMDETTINSDNIYLTNVSDNTNVNGTLTYSDKTLLLTPSEKLPHTTLFRITISSSVMNVAGLNLASDYISTFTTVDLTAPEMVSTTPSDNSSGVDTTTDIKIQFNEEIDNTSITVNSENTDCSGSIQLSKDNFETCIQMSNESVIQNNNSFFALSPAQNLLFKTKYKLKITTDIIDLAGNRLDEEYLSINGFNTHFFTSVNGGNSYNCSIMSDNAIKCWGSNHSGQLGNNSSTKISQTPVSVNGINNASQVSPGWAHTCSVLLNNTVMCWGQGIYGNLGYGGISDHLVPVFVSNLRNALQVSVFTGHSCALLDDGTVKCWGSGSSGQIGDDCSGSSLCNRLTPSIAENITNATQVITGDGLSCALLENGRVKCWGWGNSGRLGNGSESDQSTPQEVMDIATATQISTGGWHSCALLSDKSIKCWGIGSLGRLGNDITSDQYSPVLVKNIDNAIKVSSGGAFSCALLQDTTVKCWGANDFGQLGNGNYTDQHLPVLVNGITNVVQISTGNLHACALLDDNSIKCWGNGSSGQLGNNTLSNSPLPVTVLP